MPKGQPNKLKLVALECIMLRSGGDGEVGRGKRLKQVERIVKPDLLVCKFLDKC